MIAGIIMIGLTIVGLGVFYAFVQPAVDNFVRYRPGRVVRCPRTSLVANVQLDAVHAAITGIVGPPELRIRDCSLWPHQRTCDQDCLDERA